MSNLVKTNFTIIGSQGLPMAADITYPAHLKSLPIIVYAHGINGFKDWGGMPLIAEAFAEAGFAFVKFNFSHNGTVPSRPTDFVDFASYAQDNYLIRQHDLGEVITFVQSNLHDWPIDNKNISLIGHSRGGTDVLLFAKHPAISKICTWSAPALPKTPWGKWDSDKMEQWHTDGVVHLENKRTQQKLPINYQLYLEYKIHKNEALNTEKSARELNKPWLIVHGEADEAVFVKDAYLLKEWQPNVKVSIIENMGHTYDRKHPWPQTNLPEASKSVVEKTLGFLK